MTVRILSKDEELALARSWLDDGCARSRDKLARSYQPMVKRIARKYMRAGLDRDDLIQEGTIGFLAGLDNFDPDKGFSVGTLARYHIQSRMQLHIAEFVGILRLPNSRRIKGLISKCVGEIRLQENLLGRELSDTEKSLLCEKAGFALSELHEYEQAIRPVKSLSAGPSDDESVFELSDESQTPENLLKDQSVKAAASMLASILGELPERTQTILRMRHLSGEFHSFETIAEEVGISRERVRRIELDALAVVKRELSDRGISDLSDVF
jgi:RNA polymerase sigma factor (sigma-70 family)